MYLPLKFGRKFEEPRTRKKEGKERKKPVRNRGHTQRRKKTLKWRTLAMGMCAMETMMIRY
jgi:hypothetical protein